MFRRYICFEVLCLTVLKIKSIENNIALEVVRCVRGGEIKAESSNA